MDQAAVVAGREGEMNLGCGMFVKVDATLTTQPHRVLKRVQLKGEISIQLLE
jgi:hypothetical protein